MNKVVIEYCVVWNYYARAVSLAEEIKKSLGMPVQLTKSSGGRFEVFLDEELIFSKAELYRFPQPGEVLTILKGLLES